MRNIIIALTALLTLCLTACAQSNIDKNTGNMNKKILVAYFSATGTTRSVARQIASATDGTLMEIEPVETYTDADLDWRDKQSRSSVEMHNLDFRPAIVPVSYWGLAPACRCCRTMRSGKSPAARTLTCQRRAGRNVHILLS